MGYDVIKRQFAYEFGVDPYTHYKALQERLIELSRVALVGGITTKVAFAAIPIDPASITLRATGFSEGMRRQGQKTPPICSALIGAAALHTKFVADFDDGARAQSALVPHSLPRTAS